MSELKPIWYGEKTFVILSNFEDKGISRFAGNFFTCNLAEYKRYKAFLSDYEVEVIVKKVKPEEKAEEVKPELVDGDKIYDRHTADEEAVKPRSRKRIKR